MNERAWNRLLRRIADEMCTPFIGAAASLSLETTRGYLHHTRDELERSMRAPDRTVLDTAAAARTRRNGRRVA